MLSLPLLPLPHTLHIFAGEAILDRCLEVWLLELALFYRRFVPIVLLLLVGLAFSGLLWLFPFLYRCLLAVAFIIALFYHVELFLGPALASVPIFGGRLDREALLGICFPPLGLSGGGLLRCDVV